MRNPNNFLLWQNNEFSVHTPRNPHIPYTEGLHLVIEPISTHPSHAWQDPTLTGRAFELAAKICQIAEELRLAPWFNIQANGNWGLLPDATPFFHIHIYGRNKTERWGKPIVLPEQPRTYQNDPMPPADQERLKAAIAKAL